MSETNDTVTTNEIMDFLKDNMVMRSEFDSFKQENQRFQNRVETNFVTKEYLDNKLADLGAEIGRRINERTEREKKFKHELIAFLRHHIPVGDQELQKLEELV